MSWVGALCVLLNKQQLAKVSCAEMIVFANRTIKHSASVPPKSRLQHNVLQMVQIIGISYYLCSPKAKSAAFGAGSGHFNVLKNTLRTLILRLTASPADMCYDASSIFSVTGTTFQLTAKWPGNAQRKSRFGFLAHIWVVKTRFIICMSAFSDLGLSAELLEGITKLGFETPTPIQAQFIPLALSGDKDFIALAQTGTGKTAAFGLPLLQRIEPKERGIQGLVLCPTRELCVQVASDLENYSQFAHQFKVVAVYGGAGIMGQIAQIKAGAQIIVATPGRLIDLIDRRAVNLEKVARVVLDEADEMLSMGFQESLETILGAATNRRSTWLFSATMPDEVRRMASQYMNTPEELRVGGKNETNQNIEHQYFICRSEDRYDALKRVVDATPGIYGLVFCRTKNETKEIAEQMIRDGYNADALHGDLAQSDRDRVMNRFRERNLQLLIATDVAARGIDVSEISHVINYGLPDEPEVYTHRSGRTGRAGRKGISISIITIKMEERIRMIERKSRAQFARLPIPTGREVCEKQLFHIVEGIHKQEVNDAEIEPFLPRIMEELADLSKEELVKRFASVEFNRFLTYYRNAPDINLQARGAKRRETDGGGAPSGLVRYFANIGDMDGVTKKDFIHLLTREFGVPSHAIGTIDMNRAYMHFDINPSFATLVRNGLEEFSINGRRVRIDEASDRRGGDKFKGKKDGGKWEKFSGGRDDFKKKRR
jgi:ATP-dependent RNA helicase DeaD